MNRDFTEPVWVLVVALVVCAACVFRIRVFGGKSLPRWRRVSERVALSVVIMIAAAAGVSAIFNAVASRHFFELHPVPGNFYVVGGHRMHLYCTGQGSPTIILDAGLGFDSLIWVNVQAELSKTTQVCSYDRAGFGWSDPRPGPRDADHIAVDLHGLLSAAGVAGPIVLVGHSIAGLYIREYAARYPANLAGLVFVDASTPLQDDRFPAELRNEASWFEFFKLKWISVLGIPRLMGQCTHGEISGLGGQMIAEDQCRCSLVPAVEEESDAFRQSGNETVHTGPFGDLPILIFSQDPDSPAPELSVKTAKQVSVIWNEMQEDLKRLSTHSRRIIAKGSGHFVFLDRSELFDQEVANFIGEVRGKAAKGADYGSTKVE